MANGSRRILQMGKGRWDMIDCKMFAAGARFGNRTARYVRAAPNDQRLACS